MILTLAVAIAVACLISLAASWLMTRASNLSPAWNIAIGGTAALSVAFVLYLLVLLVERIAFG